MRKVATVIVLLLCVLAYSSVAYGWEIKAATIPVPADLAAGGAVDIPLDQYWRANTKIHEQTLVANKKDFPHVPNLICYRLELALGGEFELQARYIADESSPTELRIDHESYGLVFQQQANHQAQFTTLAKCALRPGKREIRFTSQKVDTPFPIVKALRLVFRGGKVPEPKPTPPIYKPRPKLADDWYKQISRKIHGDFHTAGFIEGVGKNFNADEYGKTLADSGVNAICVFAKGHHGYAYYNSKVGTRHPGLDFDLMKAQIEACHKYGIHIWVYFSIGRDELYTSTQEQTVDQPDDRSDKLSAYPDRDYVQDQVWPMIVETVRDYDPDGVFFDFPGNEDFVQKTIKLIKSIKPGMVVAYNHQWRKNHDDLRKLDVVELESWNHRMPMYHWQYFARYIRGVIPMTAMTTRFWTMWGDFGGLADEAMLRFHVATGLANGGLITIGDHLHPYGQLNSAVYERIGRVMRYAQKVEPYVVDAQSVPYVALTRPLDAQRGLLGSPARLLIDAGVHFSVIDPTADLTPYKAVIIQDGSKPTDDDVAKLETYIRNGGRLIVTGEPTTQLAKLLGIRVKDTEAPQYIRIDPTILPTPPATDLYSYLDVIPAEPLEGTQTLAPLVWQMEYNTSHRSRRQSPPSDTVSGLAAITHHKLGRGQAVYSAVPLIDVYAQWGYTPMRQIVVDLLDRMIPPAERIAQVETPAPLEVSVTRQQNRAIVHLVHCPQSRRAATGTKREDYTYAEPIIDGMPTIVGAKLHLAETLVGNRSIRLVPGDIPIEPASRKDGVVTIDVPDFQINTILVIE